MLLIEYAVFLSFSSAYFIEKMASDAKTLQTYLYALKYINKKCKTFFINFE
jgi:hypothetical protein